MERNITKKVYKSIFIGLFSAFFVFSSFSFVACGSTNVEKTTKSKALKSYNKIKTGALDNGMDYYILENETPANRIYIRLIVRAGSNLEEENEQGVAHFIEHLCFNGTKNFEKNDIVNYFEKIGMNFGSGVNAFTSFEQTVYMLECPADDPEIFKTSMQILADWAHAVSFDPEEIEKERGVVIEEWRTTSQGINGRLSNFRIIDMLKDSKHSERLPIGKPEVIKNITREEIINFYKKWYRPDLMSVVVVGDKKVSELEKVIVNTMNQIPAAEKKQILPKYNIPVQTEQRISRFVDKEQKHPIIYFIQQKTENLSCSTEEVLKENLVCGIINSIVNSRLSEISVKPGLVDSPPISRISAPSSIKRKAKSIPPLLLL
jgi:zinc protease